VLDIVDKTYDAIKKIFASSEKTTLVEKITKLSFDQMSTTALSRKFQGVQPENLPKVRASIVRSADVPTEKQADFEDFFDLIDIQDSQTFQF
jgi:DNA-directed RNA polymerase subunit F